MADPLLQVRALDAHYGDFQALFGVSMRVTEGEVVAVIGANGAGKVDVAEVHRRRDAGAPQRHPVLRRADRRRSGARGGVARHRAGAGGAAAVSLAHASRKIC